MLSSIYEFIQLTGHAYILISFLKKYKHTYLASCHKVGKLGVLIYSEAQNIIIMFLVKRLRA